MMVLQATAFSFRHCPICLMAPLEGVEPKSFAESESAVLPLNERGRSAQTSCAGSYSRSVIVRPKPP
jgi:hypothetical protein